MSNRSRNCVNTRANGSRWNEGGGLKTGEKLGEWGAWLVILQQAEELWLKGDD